MTAVDSTRPQPLSGLTAVPPPFSVISGAQVQRVLHGREREITELVEQTYRVHGAGDSVNPPSYFLRFPDRPTSRIIALPASIGGQTRVDGLKWVSSFPTNVPAGIPRASAVLILNDHDTGYPFACLECSIINATRTAASAALAADWLTRGRPRPKRIGFFGVGLIARYIHMFLAGTGWTFDEIGVYDLHAESAAGFSGYLGRSGDSGRVTVHETAESLIRSSDVVVFATVAGEPHVTDPSWLEHNPLVLHVSLRDLSPEIVLLDKHRRRRRALPQGRHLATPGRAAHRQPGLPGRHAGRRDDRAGQPAHGPAAGVLTLRPRGAGPGGRQVRLRRDGALRRAARGGRFLPRPAEVRLSRAACCYRTAREAGISRSDPASCAVR
jgi:ornithine cyclodeaminase